MKKAKQAKKTARKVVRKPNKIVTGLKQALKHARKRRAKREISPQRKSDPFWLDPRIIPAGWGYAWKTNQRPGGELPPGWGLVPYSRHTHDFPRSYQQGRFIIHGGLILMEALADQIESERWSLQVAAKAQVAEIRERFRMDTETEGRMVLIMPDGWVETEEIPRTAFQNEGPPAEVAVTLVLRVPVRWRSAAEFLKLTLSEYTRRRIVMERPVLGSMDPFSQEPVYEPINLQFSPSKES